jgi:hypothetical protein
MVIGDLDLSDRSLIPAKNYPPLIVDPNAPESL